MDNLPEKEEKVQEPTEVSETKEEKKEEKAEPVDESESDPVEVQVNLLKKQLVLAQQACFLSLIQLEKDRNPQGTNDNHRYEDLREEIAKSGQQSITKFKNELAMRLAPFTQCESTE